MMEPASQESSSAAERIWRGWIKPAVVAVFVIMTFRSAVADWNDVPTQSMEPTILVGDRILVNKLAYDLKLPFTTWRLAQWSEPQRGEVVVFFSPTDGKRMVKRIVGVPGDRIELRNNQLCINNQVVKSSRLPVPDLAAIDLTDPAPVEFAAEQLGQFAHAMMLQPKRFAMRSFGPVTVPAGHYFVLGDNRDNSGDSRIFGFVPREQIVGEAVGLAFSFDHESHWPRWERFFRGL